MNYEDYDYYIKKKMFIIKVYRIRIKKNVEKQEKNN